MIENGVTSIVENAMAGDMGGVMIMGVTLLMIFLLGTGHDAVQHGMNNNIRNGQEFVDGSKKAGSTFLLFCVIWIVFLVIITPIADNWALTH